MLHTVVVSLVFDLVVLPVVLAVRDECGHEKFVPATCTLCKHWSVLCIILQVILVCMDHTSSV